MSKKPVILTLEQLKKLSTKRLLAYKRVVNGRAYKSYDVDDAWDFDIQEVIEARKPWQKILEDIKSVLKTREHID